MAEANMNERECSFNIYHNRAHPPLNNDTHTQQNIILLINDKCERSAIEEQI